MKFLLTLLVIFQLNTSSAGTFPTLIISTTDPSSMEPLNNIVIPVEGQNFRLWRHVPASNGLTFIDSHIEIINNEVNVFF